MYSLWLYSRNVSRQIFVSHFPYANVGISFLRIHICLYHIISYRISSYTHFFVLYTYSDNLYLRICSYRIIFHLHGILRACDGLRTKKSNTKKCVYEEMRCEKMRYEKLRYEHLRTKKCDAEKSIRTFVLGPSRSFEAGRRKFMETKPPPRSEIHKFRDIGVGSVVGSRINFVDSVLVLIGYFGFG